MNANFEDLENQLRNDFYKSLEAIKEEKIKLSPFKIGDKVRIEYQYKLIYTDIYSEKLKIIGYVDRIFTRGNGFHYYFRKVKVNGLHGNDLILFPKRTKYLKIEKL